MGIRLKNTIMKVGISVISILAAIAIGAILIAAVGENPVTAYGFLLRGAFGNARAVGETLVKATPLIFTALAAVFSYRCGMFNLGAEGQFIMGAIAASWLSSNILPFGGIGNTLLSLLIGTLAGGIWGAIPGLLKAYRGLNEMIVSILMNYIATLFMAFLYSGPLMEKNIPQTAAILDDVKLTRLIEGSRVHTGIFIAIVMIILVTYFLFKTAKGYQLRVVGLNPTAANVNGLSVKRMMVSAFVGSGMIAGLGGAVELLGSSFRLMSGFGFGFGFDGVAIALIGQLHPVGAGLVAYLFAVLRTGANTMQIATGITTSVVDIVQAVIIIFAVAGTAITVLPGVKALVNRKWKGVEQ